MSGRSKCSALEREWCWLWLKRCLTRVASGGSRNEQRSQIQPSRGRWGRIWCGRKYPQSSLNPDRPSGLRWMGSYLQQMNAWLCETILIPATFKRPRTAKVYIDVPAKRPKKTSLNRLSWFSWLNFVGWINAGPVSSFLDFCSPWVSGRSWSGWAQQEQLAKVRKAKIRWTGERLPEMLRVGTWLRSRRSHTEKR